MPLEQPPVRVCCFQRHWGAVCPDGLVMCCLCFQRFEVKDLIVEDEEVVDVCKVCDNTQRRRMTNG